MTPLYGLVLAGGRSKRMGVDKTKMKWHGKEQRYYLADLLKSFCAEVFISCRPEQEQEINEQNYKTIKDQIDNSGPAAAILSAYKNFPGVAWLVVACDLPFLDDDTIQYLIQFRNLSTIATAYESPTDHLPEPLIAIWEPQTNVLLQQELLHNDFSLRKFLLQKNTSLITPRNARTLINVNCREELEKITHDRMINKAN
jgi:molybdopterin-guanine dinucleotide biosynthesis protein A